MTHPDVVRGRRDFANRIAALAQLESADLVEVLAHMLREYFVGPGALRLAGRYLPLHRRSH